MLRLLRTRRWAGFTVLVIAVIVGFGLLSRWQWHRAEEKRQDRLLLESRVDARPAVLGAGDTPRAWDPITVVGQYQADDTVVIRKRPLDATNGFWVLTPLLLADSSTVWVNRGWLAATGPATQLPALPNPPRGDVTVTGWWRDEEPSDGSAAELPTGMRATINRSELPQPGSFAGFLQRSASDPDEPALIALPRETADESRNVSYAVQWILFAVIAIGGWYFFLRREAREEEQQTTAKA